MTNNNTAVSLKDDRSVVLRCRAWSHRRLTSGQMTGQVIVLNWSMEQVCFIIYVCLHFSLIQLNKFFARAISS